ncbi:MAG: secretin N-terminal domain-containing protein, partial [Deltaproteobacteria bacterium]|nr:secretin N-terminal domain-containing protein [Deltaproteobacteria bacterium]
MTRSRSTLVILLAASVALAPACGTLKKVAGGVSPSPLAGAEPDLLTRTLEESVASARRDARKARNAPPQGVERELLPPLHVRGSAEGETFDQKFDVTVSDSPAREFFMSLVEGTPYNMVLDPAVDGAVTLTLKNVTIDEVMQAVRAVYGYEYEETSYGYHVRPSGLQTRIYELDYLNVQRRGSSQTLVSSGQITSGGSSGSSGGSSSSSGSGSGGGISGSEISTSSETDFWSELQDILGTIIGSGEGRSVAISANTGIIVVRAMPAELRAVAEYIHEAQLSLQRQVILEAKILEVRLSDRFQSGVDWALLLDSSMNPIIRAIQTGGGSILEA